jgi:replicative DNA helicase
MLSRGVQQDLITLLCFHDQSAKIIRNAIELSLFDDGVYRVIADAAYRYIDKFQCSPKQHIADELEAVLDGSDKSKANAFEKTLVHIFDSYETINPDYALSRMFNFMRRQKFRAAFIDAAELIQRDESEETMDIVEQKLYEVLRAPMSKYDTGIYLSNAQRVLEFLNKSDESFSTGIQEFDRFGLGPQRKELHLFIAPPKRGKTWWLIHLGKYALIHKLKVLHVTLEISEERTAQRYLQSLFAMGKRYDDFPQTRFLVDDSNKFDGFKFEKIRPRMAFEDEKIDKKLIKHVGKFGTRLDRVLIKEFPTGSLTVRKLESYMDQLETTEGFIPDLLIVDYPDIMDIDPRNFRLDLGKVYVDLRGIAVRKNIAVAVATQMAKAGTQKKTANETDVSEDWSKIFTAGTVLIYNQTLEEKELGLARLGVAVARHEADNFGIVISQNYATGQFCIDSSRLLGSSKYQDLVATYSGNTEETDEDDYESDDYE